MNRPVTTVVLATLLATAGSGLLAGCAGNSAARVSAHAKAVVPRATVVACSAAKLPMHRGRAVRLSVSLADTTATLTGTSGRALWPVPRLLNATVSLHTAGHGTWTRKPQPMADTPGNGVLVSGVPRPHRAASPLCLARFRTTAEPVALLGVTSAFNQCCTVVDSYAPGVQARSGEQDGLVGSELRRPADWPVLVTGDGRFFARFADYADSVPPVRVLVVSSGRQIDVTTRHSRLLRRDALRWWSAFGRRPARGLGFLAAWAADKERLGHDAEVWRTLRRLEASGRLGGTSGWPHGLAYIDQLRSFLAEAGYRS